MTIFWDLTLQRRVGSTHRPSTVKSYCDTSPTLIELPIELLSDVVSRLSFHDILNLRASSKALNYLLREDVMLRPWAQRHLRPVQAQLSPALSLHLWNHVLEQERSWSIAQNTAAIMVDYINRKVLL